MTDKLQLNKISKRFGDTSVIEDLSLAVKEGEFLVLVGPSGCGKSTVLRLIAGLESLSAGELTLEGRSLNNVPPKDRDIAMVFQNYALYPHMNVYDNMAFGLKMRKTKKPDIQRLVSEAAERLQLTPLLKRKPKELSGGQRQRVALGRAIVRNPKVFLMDEPLSNLDAKLRQHMRHELALLHNSLNATTIYVTHDQVEALTLGHRLVVLNGGKIQQVDTPQHVYDKPANRFVASFIGQMNLVPLALTKEQLLNGEAAVAELGQLNPLPSTLEAGSRSSVVIGFRPEAVTVQGQAEAPLNSGAVSLPVVAERFEMLGAEKLIYAKLQNEEANVLLARVPASFEVQTGQALTFTIPGAALHWFGDDEAGERLA